MLKHLFMMGCFHTIFVLLIQCFCKIIFMMFRFFLVNYISNIHFILFKGQRDLLNFQFVPTVESDQISDPFLPAHPDTLIKTATPIPIIAGFNNMEGMIIFGGK